MIPTAYNHRKSIVLLFKWPMWNFSGSFSSNHWLMHYSGSTEVLGLLLLLFFGYRTSCQSCGRCWISCCQASSSHVQTLSSGSTHPLPWLEKRSDFLLSNTSFMLKYFYCLRISFQWNKKLNTISNIFWATKWKFCDWRVCV